MSKLCNYISMQYQLSKEKQNKKEGWEIPKTLAISKG